jgi:hypothetical protein
VGGGTLSIRLNRLIRLMKFVILVLDNSLTVIGQFGRVPTKTYFNDLIYRLKCICIPFGCLMLLFPLYNL